MTDAVVAGCPAAGGQGMLRRQDARMARDQAERTHDVGESWRVTRNPDISELAKLDELILHSSLLRARVREEVGRRGESVL